MHISKNTPIAGIRRAMREIAQRGLLVHISELDVRINTTQDSLLTLTNQLLEDQRMKVQEVVAAFMELPARSRFGITTWGLADHTSWVMKFWKKEDYPLLFDKNYQPKPAYRGFMQGLKARE
jgi:endo-1,4-beta-xylanase